MSPVLHDPGDEPKAHGCAKPAARNFAKGAIFQCETCGQFWLRILSGYSPKWKRIKAWRARRKLARRGVLTPEA